MSNVLNITVWKDCGYCGDDYVGDNIFNTDCGDVLIYTGSLAGFEADTGVYDAVPADTTVYVGFSWILPGSVGNEYQGDVTEFDVMFTASQVLPEVVDPQCTPVQSV